MDTTNSDRFFKEYGPYTNHLGEQVKGIRIPNFLADPKWDDVSWHNDAMPSVESHKPFNNGRFNIIRIWVDAELPEDREYPSQRFHVDLLDADGMEMNEEQFSCETIEELAAYIEKVEAQEWF